MQIASLSSLATTDYSSRAMQIQVHSASLHCTDTVKWFRPGSHEQLYFNPEVPSLFTQDDAVCLLAHRQQACRCLKSTRVKKVHLTGFSTS